MKPMEERACKELADFAADGFFEVQPTAAARNIRHVKRLAATFEEVSLDGHAAGFAAALEMLQSYEVKELVATAIVLTLNASGSKGDALIHDMAAQAIRAAIRALASAPTDTPHPPPR